MLGHIASWECRSFMQWLNTASWRAITIALAITLETPTLSVAANHREIPFENSRVFGLFLIRVEANGRPAVLVVDTGSNVTTISTELADVAPGTVDNSASRSDGSFFRGRGVFRQATLRVGPIIWRDHRVVVTDTRALSKSLGQRVDGMLGIDFFCEFKVMVLDLRNHKLILDP
jgi:predicted aspartyl protease